ncbi:nitroreductase [Marinobacter halodurans]|uniref:Putative NAD(P)H nitroreductase n=1 Tax=Marinobacter halodurans TaxID=2528979 RepID=A0ABY1ZQ55_9GAMM|nr:nitroreductase family protein [Marinobacter halodurans]TBW59092.1 nitroreductase [Marinobacter halodurans]
MSKTIESILARTSEPRLTTPAPGPDVLEEVFACAARAPDHALLRPWRYLVIEGEGLTALGEVFARIADADDPLMPTVEKLQQMPRRAPMIIVGITCHQSHPKVPAIEESISTGCGMAYMLLALQARGFAGMWRTGPVAYHEAVREGLGLAPNERIAGFLYVGTPATHKPALERPDPASFVSRWPS